MNDLPYEILDFMKTEAKNRKNNNLDIKSKAYTFTKDDIYNNFDFSHEDIDEALKTLVGQRLVKKWIFGVYELLDED